MKEIIPALLEPMSNLGASSLGNSQNVFTDLAYSIGGSIGQGIFDNLKENEPVLDLYSHRAGRSFVKGGKTGITSSDLAGYAFLFSLVLVSPVMLIILALKFFETAFPFQ